MGIISIENSDRLFWLGRYSERVYTSARLFAASFDKMIDVDMGQYSIFCERLAIPNIYGSREDFCGRYISDETDPNSIVHTACRLRHQKMRGITSAGYRTAGGRGSYPGLLGDRG